jgi:hypothetical protein
MANAERCSEPLDFPYSLHRPLWRDVENHRPDVRNRLTNTYRQDIQKNGVGQINLDYFAVSIQKRDLSPEQVMGDFRRNLNSILFEGTNQRVYPLDEYNRRIWESDNPVGAIMIFEFARIGPRVLEKGAVMVTCATNQDFIFSTIRLPVFSVLFHPVSGNRAFGVFDGGHGRLQIYVKAADRNYRLENNELDRPLYELEKIVFEWVFRSGADVWSNMQQNLEFRYAMNRAYRLPPLSRRVDY